MTVYRKLQAARHELVNSGIKKTGHNSYGGWNYYELGDFIPTVHKIFDAVGLCGVVTFGETATLTVYDTDDGSSIQFSTPIVYAENNKGQPIQVLGSTHTYLRRYLWLLAMEIVESDAVDAEKQEEKKEPVKIEPKPKATKPPKVAEGTGGEWNIVITTEPNATVEQWATTAFDAAIVALTAAKSLDDVMAIFRVNRNIFDRLRADAEPMYTELMSEFKKYKEQFNVSTVS